MSIGTSLPILGPFAVSLALLACVPNFEDLGRGGGGKPSTGGVAATTGTNGGDPGAGGPGAGGPGAGALDGTGGAAGTPSSTNLADAGAGGEEPVPLRSGFGWLEGTKTLNDEGARGELGKPAPRNYPRARAYAGAAEYPFNAFEPHSWLFGGVSRTSPVTERLSDLWRYSGGAWTWVAGPAEANVPGNYGVLMTPAITNSPGAREQAVFWVDDGGVVWVFGGLGLGSDMNPGLLSDVWKFDPGLPEFGFPATGWTWMSGSASLDALPQIGTRDVAASGNTPGGRRGAAFARPSEGPLMLFGGALPNGNNGGDLWEFNEAELTWKWRGGLFDGSGPVHTTQGVPASDNQPGARAEAVACVDIQGNFWLFGGRDNNGQVLDDLWKFDGAFWTWIAGGIEELAFAEHGERGVPSANATPGGRAASACWLDADGNFYLFGGTDAFDGLLNDIWRFDAEAANWVWLAGEATPNAPASFGEKGVLKAEYWPGGCRGAAVLPGVNADGSATLLGGYGYGAVPNDVGYLTDRWRFNFLAVP